MKKSTKLITTAVALALVVAAMVVGIYAATSASSNITASVSWTAEAGVEFEINAWTYFSKEHYDSSNKIFPEASEHKISEIIVDTTITNQTASGLSATLNATFIDDSDDGVNNPRSLYYYYYFQGLSNDVPVNIAITKYPTTTAKVKVEWVDDYVHYLIGGSVGGRVDETVISPSNKPTAEFESYGTLPGYVWGMKLTILVPDENITSFDASVGFSITKA